MLICQYSLIFLPDLESRPQ